ncbi:ATPase [Veillonella nakazawae]|uniref:subtype B tannase n=1 Tax=Veillonella nakazawae TaxID=2682456 RepID=UPI00352C5A4B
MKSSRKRKVTAAFFAAAALGGVAHAAPTLNMNDLVGSNTTTESTAQGNNNVATPVVRPMATQPTPVTTQSVPKVTPLIPRVRPVPVNDIAKALSDQQRAVSQPQYVVNKQTNAVLEPTLAMHSLMNVQRKTEPVTVQKQVDGKQQVQTTQVQRTPVMVQQESTTPLVIANTTQTKAVVAKQKLTIRDIQRAEREQLAQLAAEEAAQQAGANQVDQQMVAQKQAEAQRQAAILAEQQRQTAMQAEQQRIAQQQAEAQRQAALQAEQQRIAEQQAEAQRQAAMQAEQQRIAQQQAEAQRQAALRAEQERIASQQAEQARIAEAQRQAAEQERLRIQEEQRRIAQQQAEAQRQAAMQAEQQRIAQQQAEAQRQAALKAEQDRIAAQQAEQQRIAAEQAEAQRQAALKAEQDRIVAQQAEAQRQAALQAEQQRIAAEQAEAQRQAALQAEQERIAAEQAEAQRQAALKGEQDRIAAQQAEQQRIAAEQAEAQRQAALKAEQQRMAAEQAEAQRQAALKAEQERIAAEQAEAQRQAALKAEQQRIAAEQAARQRAEAAAKAEAERQAAIKAEQDRIAAEQAEAQRQATLKAEQDRIAAEQAKAEREAALKAEQDRIAAQQAEMARQAAIKEEQERLAAEQLAKEEAESAAKAQAEAEPKAKAQAEAAAKAQAEAEAKAKAQAEAAAKAQAEAEAKAKAEAEAQAKAKENKLPQSYVDARNEASTKGSGVTEEKNILSQPIEPPLQADTSAKISLAFDVKNYESMSTTVDNKEIKYRAFEYIPYVANPIDIDQQYMNIYVPEEYFNNGTINGYNTQTAPIFMPNAVGGYMPSQAMTPKVENGKPNSVLYALSRGYVVASPATRGRTNKASDGNFIGKAPAVIVDLQAATAYLHANDSTMPGNANRIITNGTSAGGAVSLLQGATGNNSDFQPYLQALGAATAATNVYAVSAYAPITNLDAADMAYEWSYKGITSFNKVTMGQGELPQANVGGNTAPPQRTMQRVNLNADDVAYSNLLSEHFPEYVNNLQLHDSMGRVLKLDKNGNGTFKNYVKAFIIDAANKAQAKGTDLSKHTYFVRDNKTGAIKDINWEAYNQFVSRSKAPGAFDSRSNDSGENNLFGTSATDNNHFTITAALHDTTPNQDVYVENAKIVTMMNPMNYLGSPAATNARYYRIRYGTADSNTSVAIPLIVGTRAQNLGYNVDMATPFDVDHSGDYDLDELFNWMDNIVKNGR